MKAWEILLLFMSLFFIACSSNDIPEENAIVFTYEKGMFADMTLQYRKGVFLFNVSEKRSIVVYLHGGSSRGDDNEKPLQEPGVDSIRNYLSSRHINAIFLIPQCPSNVKAWGGKMNMVLRDLIVSFIDSGITDPDKVYILGGSMGGTGTWSMLSDYPSLFSAAMPVAGNPSGTNADNLLQTPIYTVMGKDDMIMDENVRLKVSDLIYYITSHGNEARMDETIGWTHEDTCVKAYTTERLDWIFHH